VTQRSASLAAAGGLLLALLTGCAGSFTPEDLGLAPVPSSSRLACLTDVARRANASLATDEVTGVVTLERAGRRVAVAPGVGAALLGSRLVVLGSEVVGRYGRAYVPRSLERDIEAYLTGREPETKPRTTAGQTKPPGTQGKTPLAIPRVCIDPGHGGRDPGAVSRWGLREKEVVLSTAILLATELRGRGFEAVLTRDDDTFTELNDRPAVAARRRADLFVAVHVNAIRDSSFRGIEIFYPLTQDGGGPGVRRQSAELAEAMRHSFSAAGFTVRKLQARDLRVLKLAEMPAVLLELGFLTNRAEEQQLRSSAHRQRLARAIADGVERFCGRQGLVRAAPK